MAGYTLLENKYYFDALYSGVIAEGVKGPIARAAYWINQNVIDGVLNGTAAIARASATASTTRSTRVWSTGW